MSGITRLQMISPYAPPQYLVHPIYEECDQEEIDSVEEFGYTTLDPVTGWPPYTHVIVADVSHYYLARIED